jgi:hypothetical protein
MISIRRWALRRLKWLFGGGILSGVLCQTRPEQRHFQQNSAVVWSAHVARKFYALGGEVLIRITPVQL